MRLKRLSMAVAAGAVAALALASCAPGGPATPSSSNTSGAPSSGASTSAGQVAQIDGSGKLDLKDIKTQDGEIKVSVGATEYKGYNTSTAATYETYSTAVSNMYLPTFMYFGTDGKTIVNKDLGSIEKVSDDPLTVKYTINDNAKWSDGTPITVNDAIMAWGTQNSKLVGADGNPLFSNVSTDLAVDFVPDGPVGDPDGKTFTVKYKSANPDWMLQTFLDYPAHVVAKQAGMTTAELSKAFLAKDASKLADAAKFWNTGWNTKPGTIPAKDINVSGGPYILDSWKAGESVTLKANPNYYGAAPGVKTLTFRFVDPGSMVQALQNKDLDVMAPQPTVDTLDQLKALGNSVKIMQGDTMTWEHLDFNFAGTSVFKDDPELRKAFAMCIPRETIVKNLIQPVNPDAKVLNAREVLPSDPEKYAEVVKDSYAGEYDAVNIDGAKKILEDKGKTNMKVRIGYNSPNPRRANEVSLIKDSCGKAGFDVQDISSAEFSAPGGPVEKNDYDAFLFAWAGSGQIAGGQNIYSTKYPQNFGKYSNKTVDEAFKTLSSSLDPAVHTQQTIIIEKELWKDMFGVPLFAHPGLDAAGSNIENVMHTSTQNGITWNAEQFQRAE